jgi:hypothetical protein
MANSNISPEDLREMEALIDILKMFPPDEPSSPVSEDPLRLHPSRVQTLRAQLHELREPMDDPRLEQFVENVFADDLMVECYFQPRVIRSRTLPLYQWEEEQLPLDAALRAARQARGAAILADGLERQVAYAAALVYPCGLFNCLHPWVVHTTGRTGMTFEWTRQVTADLLDWPLHLLRLDLQDMGETLSAVFEQGIENDADPAQVGRIGAAVWAANRRVKELWAT